MGLVKFYEVSFADDFEGAWEDFRTISIEGIVYRNDDEIRNLYAKFSALQAHYELLLSEKETEYNRAKIDLENQEALLLFSDESKTAAQKKINVDANEEVQKRREILEKKEAEFIIVRQKIKAVSAICVLLSREITARTNK